MPKSLQLTTTSRLSEFVDGIRPCVRQRKLHFDPLDVLMESANRCAFLERAGHTCFRRDGDQMKCQNLTWSPSKGWVARGPLASESQLLIVFSPREHLEEGKCLEQLRNRFPTATVIGCSTGGQIDDGDVTDSHPAALALYFEKSRVRLARESITHPEQSTEIGTRLGASLSDPDLKGIMVLSDGLLVNGSKLIEGLQIGGGDGVVVTGGLAGDGARFEKTLVVADGQAASGLIAAVGFYGPSILIGHGSAGGWDSFGPKRLVTASQGNVLRGLDHKPALDLYKTYLGDEAEGLPGTALLYPLMITDPSNADHTVVRTVLAVDHENSTMTFAGDVPEGWSAQLMRGQFENLANGAGAAAVSAAIEAPGSDVAGILISCVGRRLLMGESIVDEIEAATRALGPSVRSVGFYSYGEISPHGTSGVCELHNQTMTITTIAEKE